MPRTERRRRIFISYRRADSAGHAGRLKDDLIRLLGHRVFMDVSDIAPGAKFPGVLDAELRSCGAVLAVIGPQWRATFDGRREGEDYVRIELQQALAHEGVSVVPVLIHVPRSSPPDDASTTPSHSGCPIGRGSRAPGALAPAPPLRSPHTHRILRRVHTHRETERPARGSRCARDRIARTGRRRDRSTRAVPHPAWQLSAAGGRSDARARPPAAFRSYPP